MDGAVKVLGKNPDKKNSNPGLKKLNIHLGHMRMIPPPKRQISTPIASPLSGSLFSTNHIQTTEAAI